MLEEAGHEVVVSEKKGDLTKSELIKELQKAKIFVTRSKGSWA